MLRWMVSSVHVTLINLSRSSILFYFIHKIIQSITVLLITFRENISIYKLLCFHTEHIRCEPRKFKSQFGNVWRVCHLSLCLIIMTHKASILNTQHNNISEAWKIQKENLIPLETTLFCIVEAFFTSNRSVKNLGIIINKCNNMNKYVTSIFRAAYSNFNNTQYLKLFLLQEKSVTVNYPCLCYISCRIL